MERPTFGARIEQVRQGFDRVMAQVRRPGLDLEQLFEAFVPAFWSGDPRQLDALLQAELNQPEFSWAWFGTWEARFSAAGVWPTAWSEVRWAAEPISPPVDMASALPLFTLKVLREWLRTSGFGEPDLGHTKARFWPAFEALVPWHAFAATAEARYLDERARNGQDVPTQKIKMLGYAISASVYALRHYEDSMRVRSYGLTRWKCELSDAGDRLERLLCVPEVATAIQAFDPEDFASYPPFFPGDSSMVMWRPDRGA